MTTESSTRGDEVRHRPRFGGGAPQLHGSRRSELLRDADAFYKAESLVDRLAKGRGFGKNCVAVIGDSPGNVAAEGRLAQDLKAAVSALQQQNPDALQTLSDQINADIQAIRPGPTFALTLPAH